MVGEALDIVGGGLHDGLDAMDGALRGWANDTPGATVRLLSDAGSAIGGLANGLLDTVRRWFPF